MTRENIERRIRERIVKRKGHIDEDAFAEFWADENVQEQVEYHLDEQNLPESEWNWYVAEYERTLKKCRAYHTKQVAKMPREFVHGNRRLYEMRKQQLQQFLPEVNFTERDTLVIALMRETASYFAEQLPEVRLVREQLLCGEPLTDDELDTLERYIVFDFEPDWLLNVLQVEDVAGIGLAPFLRNPPRLPLSPVPVPGSVGEALQRAVEAILSVVLNYYDEMDAAHWLLRKQWLDAPSEGRFVMPRLWQWKTCIPAHLEPRTIVRIYQRLATFSTLLVHDAKRPMRVRRPSLRTLKRALEAVVRLRAGHTWKQIATDWGVPPSHAKRTLVRVWNALGIPENLLTLAKEEHEDGEASWEQ